jgi:hypothetical protein
VGWQSKKYKVRKNFRPMHWFQLVPRLCRTKYRKPIHVSSNLQNWKGFMFTSTNCYANGYSDTICFFGFLQGHTVRKPKTNFVEVRTFLHLFRSFNRMWMFFILAFQVIPLSEAHHTVLTCKYITQMAWFSRQC